MKMIEFTGNDFKCLENVIKEKVDEIGFEMFQPPIERQILKDRLEAIFCVDTPYWQASQVPPGWAQNWFAIQPRVFRNNDPVEIGISVSASSLRIVVYDGIWENDFEEEFHRIDLSIEDLWLNHGKFYEEFSETIGRAVRFVGQNRPEGFNWED